ncbi:30S ribosomal protein S1 [Thermodesulfovibrionales bacterium]|nr:30S ribosomal protein S1 [Thermodesulfovibrionales bacterium]
MNMETQEETKEIERLYAETLHKVERGSITKGKVIAVKSDRVVVDVGYKSEGIMHPSEFPEKELSEMKEGDDVEVFIERINDQEGVVTLSRGRALKIEAWKTLTDAYNNNSYVEGKVIGKTKGGVLVDVAGITAFLPSSQVDIKPLRELDSFIGQTISLKILKLMPPKNYFDSQVSGTSLIVSRRAIIEEERSRKKEEILKVMKEGAVLRGVVKNITDYGVFVDLGGIDSLLHISDISWRKVNHPSEFFSIEDEDEFIVIKYDTETEKVTLGYKQKRGDPWLFADEKYKPDMRVKGRVVNIVDYGFFVEVEEGLEGLVHISELDWTTRPRHPSKYVSVGEEIEAMVMRVNKGERRLSLGIKQLKPRPWELIKERYKVGQVITGKVKTLTDFGVFVRLPEGVDGLIHISDLSWVKHIKHPSEVLKKGHKVDAVILTLEPDKERMALGIKQLTPDPWKDEIPKQFKHGDELKGQVSRITDFGIFVKLRGDIEGFVYPPKADISGEFKEGDEIEVRIVKVNAEERKIGLSIKNINSGDEQ